MKTSSSGMRVGIKCDNQMSIHIDIVIVTVLLFFCETECTKVCEDEIKSHFTWMKYKFNRIQTGIKEGAGKVESNTLKIQLKGE